MPADLRAAKALADTAGRRATTLITQVRDIDPADVWASLADLDGPDLAATIVVLAAMVPDDRPVSQLTQWCSGMVPQHVDRAHRDADMRLDLTAVDRHLAGDRSVRLSSAEKRAAADIANGWGWEPNHLAARTGMTRVAADKALERARRRQRDYMQAVAS